MIRNYYRAPYVQRGHGLGSIFRGVAKFFRPLARNIVSTFNNPAVKKVLKTVGKETLGTGSELLIDSLKGNDIDSKLDQRIKKAKQRIADSIADGINTAKQNKKSKTYTRLIDDEHEKTSHKPSLMLRRKSPVKVGKYQTLEDMDNLSLRKTTYKKRKPNLTLANLSKKRNVVKGHQTVFD